MEGEFALYYLLMVKAYRTSITTHVNGRPHVYDYDLTQLQAMKLYHPEGVKVFNQ